MAKPDASSDGPFTVYHGTMATGDRWDFTERHYGFTVISNGSDVNIKGVFDPDGTPSYQTLSLTGNVAQPTGTAPGHVTGAVCLPRWALVNDNASSRDVTVYLRNTPG